ncbi:hypothetical protein R3W88_031584 [Solanum pinnatisectum]|uniref:Uncharacterized protein n=1 Tax=Solanum pinnatisectum TaxID=50273 RepID=A0AAV9LLS6_9SOLN|nr:hypothetical protein R3W88_031584 [Solanum pinnatisectum]
MSPSSNYQFFSLVSILLLISVDPSSQSQVTQENAVKSSIFLSPAFVLEPASVSNKFYYNIGFPKGHIAIKSFEAELVDEIGNSVPLYETYLHHWVVSRYFNRKGVEVLKYHYDLGNLGICGGVLSTVYFGVGPETRKIIIYISDPYGIEVCNLVEVPPGYKEKWMVNLHAIDTRGAEDRLGCTECRYDLYNVTKDENNRDIEPDYIGGSSCCYDGTICKYTVKYIDWDAFIMPVNRYLLDITDTWKKPEKLNSTMARHHCKIEYLVESCAVFVANVDCTHIEKISVIFPSGEDLIYGVAHQHIGGTGMALHGEDEHVICSSLPIYGKGKEPGNEVGYIVGMSKGETITLLSNYSNDKRHTGVLGLFYLLVAEPSPKANSILHSADGTGEIVILQNVVGSLAVFGIALLVGAAVIYQHRNKRDQEGY